MLRADRLDVDRAFMLVIDFQEKLLPLIRDHEQIIAAACKLLDGVRVFSLPILATEQYPQGVGVTTEPIRRRLKESDATTLDKLTFSACDQPEVRDALTTIDRPQVLVIGIEAHVCVQQTVLDLRSMAYEVFVCADAVGSRGPVDYDRSLERMRQAGAFMTTVESALFELCNRCDTPEFKNMLKIIKATPPTGI